MDITSSLSSQQHVPLQASHRLNSPCDNKATYTTPKKRTTRNAIPFLYPSPIKESKPTSGNVACAIATPSRECKRMGQTSRIGDHADAQEDTFSSSNLSLSLQQAKGEHKASYGTSPSSVLPRHSRGIDFSRAATNLHHSTLAEQPSPDSSPTIPQRIPGTSSRRSSIYSNMAVDPSYSGTTAGWYWPNSSTADRIMISKSVCSTNAIASDGSSSSSDDDMLMDQDAADDSCLSYTQTRQTDAAGSLIPSDTSPWAAEPNGFVQLSAPNAFANYRRNVFGKRHTRGIREHPYSRHRTSSPEMSGVTTTCNNTTSLGGHDPALHIPRTHRESLSLGIGDVLHITSSNEDNNESSPSRSKSTIGVVRRPVTRRSNLLPKSKNFARIRAALQEECSPVDTEVRRESEVVRQVRVKDIGRKDLRSISPPSPNIRPNVFQPSEIHSEVFDADLVRNRFTPTRGSILDADRASFNQPHRSRTPPPNNSCRPRSPSGVRDDILASPQQTKTPPPLSRSLAEQIDSLARRNTYVSSLNHGSQLPSAAEMTKKMTKRHREDDLDANSFKRRAVSPGISVQSSPVLGQSPMSSGGWQPRPSRENSLQGTEEKGLSGDNARHSTAMEFKRVGLQGMNDTNNELMKMSIE